MGEGRPPLLVPGTPGLARTFLLQSIPPILPRRKLTSFSGLQTMML